MWMSFLVVLYLPTLLLLAIAHSGALDGLSCSTAGFCQLLGAPFGMNVEEPTTGDVLVIGVVLGVSWLSAAALLARRARREDFSVDHTFSATLLVAHGMLLYAGWRTGATMVTRINAARTMDALATHLPPEYDFRKGWRMFGSGLFGSVGAVPARSIAEGFSCSQMVRLGSFGLSGISDGSKVLCTDKAVLRSATQPGCIVVSVGSNGDFAFEESIHTRFPHCTVHVFDGTFYGRPELVRPPSWLAPTFHYADFNETSYRMFAGARVAIFKMDCEGCEHASLLPFVQRTCTEIMLVEVHANARADGVVTLLKALNTTHGLYYAEPNPGWKPKRHQGVFVELALASRHPGSGAACQTKLGASNFGGRTPRITARHDPAHQHRTHREGYRRVMSGRSIAQQRLSSGAV